MGINTISTIPFIVASFLNLEKPDEYTGHSLRATSATVLADSGVSIENLKRHGQWKSTTVMEGYIRDSKKMKTEIASALTTLNNNATTTTTTSSSSSSTVPLPETTSYNGPVFINCVFEGSLSLN